MKIKIKINLGFFKSTLQVRNSALKLKMAGELRDVFVMLLLWLLVNVTVQGSLPYGPLLIK